MSGPSFPRPSDGQARIPRGGVVPVEPKDAFDLFDPDIDLIYDDMPRRKLLDERDVRRLLGEDVDGPIGSA